MHPQWGPLANTTDVLRDPMRESLIITLDDSLKGVRSILVIQKETFISFDFVNILWHYNMHRGKNIILEYILPLFFCENSFQKF